MTSANIEATLIPPRTLNVTNIEQKAVSEAEIMIHFYFIGPILLVIMLFHILELTNR